MKHKLNEIVKMYFSSCLPLVVITILLEEYLNFVSIKYSIEIAMSFLLLVTSIIIYKHLQKKCSYKLGEFILIIIRNVISIAVIVTLLVFSLYKIENYSFTISRAKHSYFLILVIIIFSIFIFHSNTNISNGFFSAYIKSWKITTTTYVYSLITILVITISYVFLYILNMFLRNYIILFVVNSLYLSIILVSYIISSSDVYTNYESKLMPNN